MEVAGDHAVELVNGAEEAELLLLQGRPAHVWRLDGNTANTAEAAFGHKPCVDAFRARSAVTEAA